MQHDLRLYSMEWEICHTAMDVNVPFKNNRPIKAWEYTTWAIVSFLQTKWCFPVLKPLLHRSGTLFNNKTICLGQTQFYWRHSTTQMSFLTSNFQWRYLEWEFMRNFHILQFKWDYRASFKKSNLITLWTCTPLTSYLKLCDVNSIFRQYVEFKLQAIIA